MNIKQNVCVVFRGELLRNPLSSYHNNGIGKSVREYDLSEESFTRQNNIMESIITHIIIPYENIGYNVFISGCVYDGHNYNKKLTDFFPNNTITQIKSGKTNQAELFYRSIDHAEKKHPNCIEYISIRADYIMLKNIIRKDLGNLYTGFSWKNNNIPQVDVFFIISKNTINILKNILCNIGNKKKYTHTHSIYRYLQQNKVRLYPIWTNYEDKPTGISYKEYINDIKMHENRPFVNYMRL